MSEKEYNKLKDLIWEALVQRREYIRKAIAKEQAESEDDDDSADENDNGLPADTAYKIMSNYATQGKHEEDVKDVMEAKKYLKGLKRPEKKPKNYKGLFVKDFDEEPHKNDPVVEAIQPVADDGNHFDGGLFQDFFETAPATPINRTETDYSVSLATDD